MVLTYFHVRSKITAIFITLKSVNFVKMAKIAIFAIFAVIFKYLNLVRLSSPVYIPWEMPYIFDFYPFWDHKCLAFCCVLNGRHFLGKKLTIFVFFDSKTSKTTQKVTFFQRKHECHLL